MIRLALIGLLVFTGFLYAGIRSHGYVYEDFQTLQAEPGLERGDLWRTVPNRMLSTASLYLLAKIDPTPAAQHLCNLWLHLLNGCLVFWILESLSGSMTDGGRSLGTDLAPSRKVFAASSSALIGTALFLLHPIQSEAVNYVTARTDLLSSFFLLLSTLCVLSNAWVLALGSLLLALISKESAIVGLGLLPLVAGRSGHPVPRWLVYVASVGLGVALSIKVPTMLSDTYVWSATSFWLPFLSFWRLVWLGLVPVGFSVEHVYSTAWGWGSLAVLGVVLLAGWSWRIAASRPRLAFGIAWGLLALWPRFILRLPEPIAERQFYLAFFGMCVVLVDLMAYSAHQKG